VHLRQPSIDKGVTSFLWTLLFFFVIWLGAVSVGVSVATAFLIAVVAAFGIFFFVRLNGEERPRRDDLPR